MSDGNSEDDTYYVKSKIEIEQQPLKRFQSKSIASESHLIVWLLAANRYREYFVGVNITNVPRLRCPSVLTGVYNCNWQRRSLEHDCDSFLGKRDGRSASSLPQNVSVLLGQGYHPESDRDHELQPWQLRLQLVT